MYLLAMVHTRNSSVILKVHLKTSSNNTETNEESGASLFVQGVIYLLTVFHGGSFMIGIDFNAFYRINWKTDSTGSVEINNNHERANFDVYGN